MITIISPTRIAMLVPSQSFLQISLSIRLMTLTVPVPRLALLIEVVLISIERLQDHLKLLHFPVRLVEYTT
jgi:hypothetical protein